MILRRFPLFSLARLKWRLALIDYRPPRSQIWTTRVHRHPNLFHDHDGIGM